MEGLRGLEQRWQVHTLKFEFRLDLLSKTELFIFLVFLSHPTSTPPFSLYSSHYAGFDFNAPPPSSTSLFTTSPSLAVRRSKRGQLSLTPHEDVSRIASAITSSYHHTLTPHSVAVKSQYKRTASQPYGPPPPFSHIPLGKQASENSSPLRLLFSS